MRERNPKRREKLAADDCDVHSSLSYGDHVDRHICMGSSREEEGSPDHGLIFVLLIALIAMGGGILFVFGQMSSRFNRLWHIVNGQINIVRNRLAGLNIDEEHPFRLPADVR